MPISFIEIPTDYWTRSSDTHTLPGLFHQLRLSESRISKGVNASVERKRHHKICNVVENIARVLTNEQNAKSVLEFPLTIKNRPTIPSSSYLQLTELLMATTDKRVAIIDEPGPSQKSILAPMWLRYLRQIIQYLVRMIFHEKSNAKADSGRSVNLRSNPTSALQIDNHWLSRFSDTPAEVATKLRLFELLHNGTFQQYFGSIIDTEIIGYRDMLRCLVRTYRSAATRGSGIIVVANVDVD